MSIEFLVIAYAVVSVALMIAVPTRLWLRHGNIYDVQSELLENSVMWELVYTNFACMIYIFACSSLVYYIIRPVKDSEHARLSEYVSTWLSTTAAVFVFGGFKGFQATYHVYMTLFFLGAAESLFANRVDEFTIELTPSPPANQYRMAFGWLLIMAVSWRIFVSSLRMLSETMTWPLITLQHRAVQLFLSAIHHLILQFVNLMDQENHGNSLWVSKLRRLLDIVFQSLYVIGCAAGAVLAIRERNINWMVIEIIHFGLDAGQTLWKYVQLFRRRRQLTACLRDVTEEDLEKDDVCIVCRSSMDVESAKKMPCGHCVHSDCLERWMTQSSNCPVCQRDVTSVEVNEEDFENGIEMEVEEAHVETVGDVRKGIDALMTDADVSEKKWRVLNDPIGECLSKAEQAEVELRAMKEELSRRQLLKEDGNPT